MPLDNLTLFDEEAASPASSELDLSVELKAGASGGMVGEGVERHGR